MSFIHTVGKSRENITFSPFEEYVKDILSCQRSAYTEIASEFNKVFGLCLGVIIAAIFYLIKPEDLISVGSIVSVIGAYIIGRELWEDIVIPLILALYIIASRRITYSLSVSPFKRGKSHKTTVEDETIVYDKP